MNKQYIKPTSTSIKFEMRESVLLNCLVLNKLTLY